MKKINEMTHDEKLALTSEQVERLVKIECMERGVRIPEIPIEPTRPHLEKKVVAYKVHGIDFLFKTSEEANEALAVLQKSKLFTSEYDYYGAGYDYKWLKTAEVTAEVSQEKYCFQEDVKSLSVELKNFKNQKELYEKTKKDYDAELAEFRSISSEIHDDWYLALRLQREADSHKVRFKDYLDLANNDEEKAMAFYRKAHLVSPEVSSLLGWEQKEGVN